MVKPNNNDKNNSLHHVMVKPNEGIQCTKPDLRYYDAADVMLQFKHVCEQNATYDCSYAISHLAERVEQSFTITSRKIDQLQLIPELSLSGQ